MHVSQIAAATVASAADPVTELSATGKDSSGEASTDFIALLLAQLQGIFSNTLLPVETGDASEMTALSELTEGMDTAEIFELMGVEDLAGLLEKLGELENLDALSPQVLRKFLDSAGFRSGAAIMQDANDLDLSSMLEPQTQAEVSQGLARLFMRAFSGTSHSEGAPAADGAVEEPASDLSWKGMLEPSAQASLEELLSEQETVDSAEGISLSKVLDLLQAELARQRGEQPAKAMPAEHAAHSSESIVRLPFTAQDDKTASVEQIPRTFPVVIERTEIGNVGEVTVRSIRYLATNGRQTYTIKLIPESLGEIRVDVTKSPEEMSIRLASANPMVREVLEGQIQTLREALEQDGIDVGSVSVTGETGIAQEGFGQRGHQDSYPAQSRVAFQLSGAGRSSDSGLGAEASSRVRASHHIGDLNVFV